jgi:hypothetical protein
MKTPEIWRMRGCRCKAATIAKGCSLRSFSGISSQRYGLSNGPTLWRHYRVHKDPCQLDSYAAQYMMHELAMENPASFCKHGS